MTGQVARLKWQNFDFDGRTASIWQGKGRKDRQVMLREGFKPSLIELSFRRPVSRMQIALRPSKAEVGAANVTLTIHNEGRFVLLKGIVVREPRPGWVTLEGPPLEACGIAE
ncbi:MAG: hypothetical protein HUU20_19495 [Pirellulales bacterium]|nr:hypothetical protein [Pirellulales bacterium]